MKRRLLWVAVAVTAVSVLGFLLLKARQPKPIARASLALETAAKPASTAAGIAVQSRTRRGDSGIPQSVATEAVKDEKKDPFGPPHYAPRPADEWQGMLINLNITPPCNSSAECGLARACINSKCMPCERDEQCANDEACVLQHCISVDRVECRHTAECGAGSKCILSGYSREPRGNEGTRSYCNSDISGAARVMRPEPLPKRDGPLPPLATDHLVEAARAAAAAAK